MAHKSFVNGTSYKISGGNTLVDGTAYSIKRGETLVGGTDYKIDLVRLVNVHIGKKGTLYTVTNADYAYVTINGQVYDGSETVLLSVPRGTKIICSVKTSSSVDVGKIKVDNKIVAETPNVETLTTYEMIVSGTTSIAVGADFFVKAGQIDIYNGKIVFFDGVFTYTAYENTTWSDFFADETIFLKPNWTIIDGFFYNSDGTKQILLNSAFAVKVTDAIVPFGVYNTSS